MASHRDRAIERAIGFIVDHADEPLTVAQVAKAAAVSEFHLNRLFHQAVGESIGRFITRRRLELGALRLAYEPDRNITDIALSSGYSSSSNFSKAFSAYFGCSPARVREPGAPGKLGTLTTHYGKDFSPADLYALPSRVSGDEREREAKRWSELVRFETVPELGFACLASSDGYDLAALHHTWGELIARAQALGLCQDDVDAWGISHDSPTLTAPELCRYHACVPCPPGPALPPPLFAGKRSAGRYAIFRYRGPVDEVADAYRGIYSCWFQHSSLAPADYTPLDHYVADFPEEGRIEMEMWLRVRPRRAG